MKKQLALALVPVLLALVSFTAWASDGDIQMVSQLVGTGGGKTGDECTSWKIVYNNSSPNGKTPWGVCQPPLIQIYAQLKGASAGGISGAEYAVNFGPDRAADLRATCSLRSRTRPAASSRAWPPSRRTRRTRRQGIHNITLKRNEYVDNTFSVNIIADETSTVGPIMLVSDIQTTIFNLVRIYESYGTPASLPSGIDLSTGNAWGISSDSSHLVDIYFYSDAGGNSYLIRSADLAGLIRETDFLVGSGTNLLDGTDSPLRKTETWTKNIDRSEDNYVFLYDDDDHYSKFLIVNRGGGLRKPSLC